MQEVWEWKEYRDKYGSLNLHYIVDRGFAMLGHFLCTANGIKISNEVPSMTDLMLRPKPEEKVCEDINQAFSFMLGLKKNG